MKTTTEILDSVAAIGVIVEKMQVIRRKLNNIFDSKLDSSMEKIEHVLQHTYPKGSPTPESLEYVDKLYRIELTYAAEYLKLYNELYNLRKELHKLRGY